MDEHRKKMIDQRYPDDIVLIADDQREIQETTRGIEGKSQKISLTINMTKTKIILKYSAISTRL